MKTGLVNMGIGIAIAAVGALVTALTYSMVSRGGGTYVVAYGAFIVGAWRFLLGLFQVLSSPFGKSSAQPTVAPPTQTPSRADFPPRTDIPPQTGAPLYSGASVRPRTAEASSGVQLIGGLLMTDAVLRIVLVGLLVSRVHSTWMLHNTSFVLSAIVLPLALAIGGFVVGPLLLRNWSGAIALGIGLCAVGLLVQAFGLVSLLSVPFARVPAVTWILAAIHVSIYVAGLIVLAQSAGKTQVSVASS